MEPIHLDDGAYVSERSGDIVLTANHHDPERATDTVYLTALAIENLLLWLEERNENR